MADHTLRRFHEDMLAQYVTCWNHAQAREECEVSEEEAAYSLLEHAGHLGRIDGTEHYLHVLRELAAGERRKLALAACRYIMTINLDEQTRHTYENEALEKEQIDFIGSLLIRRDSLEGALSLAVQICHDIVHQDEEVSRSLAEARCRAAEIDDTLLERPDIIAAAAPVLEGLKQAIRTPFDSRAFWWFSAEQGHRVDVEHEWQQLLSSFPPHETATMPAELPAALSPDQEARPWFIPDPAGILRLVELFRQRLQDTIRPTPALAALHEADAKVSAHLPRQQRDRLELARDNANLVWHVRPSRVISESASLEVGWSDQGLLLHIATYGFLRQGKGITVRVVWRSCEGLIRAEAVTDPATPESPLKLAPRDGEGPKSGDRLQVRYTSRRGDDVDCDIELSVAFE